MKRRWSAPLKGTFSTSFARWIAPLMLGVIGVRCASAPGVELSSPANFESLQVFQLDGSKKSWGGTHAAEKRTLVVFMTTWCPACKREQPQLTRWAESNSRLANTVVVVSGSEIGRVLEVVDERRMRRDLLRIVVDRDGTVAKAYRVESTPTIVMLDEGGKEVERFSSIEEVPGEKESKLERVFESGQELGTTYDVLVLAKPGRVEHARADLAEARELVRELERKLSEWRDDSEISRVNRLAGTQEVALGSDLRRVLTGALHLSEITNGAFDVTWRAIGDVWDRAERSGKAPEQAQIDAALATVGWRNVRLTDGGVRFTDARVKLGIAGVAKGWIIDSAYRLLRKRGYEHVVVNIGGDLRTSGRDVNGLRRVFRIADPYTPSQSAASIEIENTAIATSGNYLRSRLVGGADVGHIVDPRTGFPPAFDGSVTVLSRDAAMADALATALFVVGPDQGLELARELDGVEVIYATRDGLRTTLEGLVTESSP